MRGLCVRACTLCVGAILGGVAGAAPPAGLRCVERYFAARAVEKNGLWYAVTRDGQRYLWDFGEPHPLEERLRVPDVEDMFALPYRAGAIAPVTTIDEDPGRVRHLPLFDATYPTSQLATGRFFGQKVRLQRKVLAPLSRVEKRLERAIAAEPSLRPFVAQLGASWAERRVAGTTLASAHEYGIAIDLNPKLSSYWRWQKPPEPVVWRNQVPQAIVSAFEAEGFIWGGRWYHYDTAHFEYRPELLDPACAPR